MARFIFTLVIIDTFFVAFYLGFNSRQVMVVDASLPPYVAPAPTPVPAAAAKSGAGGAKKIDAKPASKSAEKPAEKSDKGKHHKGAAGAKVHPVGKNKASAK